MEPISFSSTSGMTSNANFQPTESTSKAIFMHITVHSKTLGFYGQSRALWALCSQVPTFMEPISFSSTSGMTSTANLQPNEGTSKAIFSPTKVFQRQLASIGKLEPCEHTKATIQIIWNQLASLNPLGWLPLAIFKPMRILSKHIFNQTWVLSRT